MHACTCINAYCIVLPLYIYMAPLKVLHLLGASSRKWGCLWAPKRRSEAFRMKHLAGHRRKFVS